MGCAVKPSSTPETPAPTRRTRVQRTRLPAGPAPAAHLVFTLDELRQRALEEMFSLHDLEESWFR